ncbi:unnamed protein product [Rotaria socialis]|uniref:Uncharacterized protein n=1 Tax=Rotaria socialis TaxID=392032 RepID=A0A818BGT9_9BILA|nr:unnamed protein product [Rotaria socialis]
MEKVIDRIIVWHFLSNKDYIIKTFMLLFMRLFIVIDCLMELCYKNISMIKMFMLLLKVVVIIEQQFEFILCNYFDTAHLTYSLLY